MFQRDRIYTHYRIFFNAKADQHDVQLNMGGNPYRTSCTDNPGQLLGGCNPASQFSSCVDASDVICEVGSWKVCLRVGKSCSEISVSSEPVPLPPEPGITVPGNRSSAPLYGQKYMIFGSLCFPSITGTYATLEQCKAAIAEMQKKQEALQTTPPPPPPPPAPTPEEIPSGKAECMLENGKKHVLRTCPPGAVIRCPVSWEQAASRLGEGFQTCRRRSDSVTNEDSVLTQSTIVQVIQEKTDSPKPINSFTRENCEQYEKEMADANKKDLAYMKLLEKTLQLAGGIDEGTKISFETELKRAAQILRLRKKALGKFQCHETSYEQINGATTQLQTQLNALREILLFADEQVEEKIKVEGIEEDMRSIETLLQICRKMEKRTECLEASETYDTLKKNFNDEIVSDVSAALETEIVQFGKEFREVRRKLESLTGAKTKQLKKVSEKGKTLKASAKKSKLKKTKKISKKKQHKK